MRPQARKIYGTIGILFAILAIVDGVLWSRVFASLPRNHLLELDFLNIGQGDSELIQFANGEMMVIDGGPPQGKLLDRLDDVLPPGTQYIDLLMMTHPQLDHFGGLIDVLKKYRVGMFLGSGRKGEIAAYGTLEQVLREKKVPYQIIREGDHMKIGGDTITFLNPDSQNVLSGELNDTCLVALLNHDGFRALYTGDIGSNIEDELIKKYDLAAQVLKVGHHGSRFSSSAEFLSAVKPNISVIEVGKNTYGHPTEEALKRLTDSDTKIYRTDQSGTLRIQVKDGAMTVLAER